MQGRAGRIQSVCRLQYVGYCFFFNDPATTEIYTLSLHDALPILPRMPPAWKRARPEPKSALLLEVRAIDRADRKSTRLNSSHSQISYAVFCLKKKTRTEMFRLLARDHRCACLRSDARKDRQAHSK